jgi:hypothetical protein
LVPLGIDPQDFIGICTLCCTAKVEADDRTAQVVRTSSCFDEEIVPNPDQQLGPVGDLSRLVPEPAELFPLVMRDCYKSHLVSEVLRGAHLGARVKRGPDWEWDNEDNWALGTTTRFDVSDKEGWVKVRWDAGTENIYRVGAGGKYDLRVIGCVA